MKVIKLNSFVHDAVVWQQQISSNCMVLHALPFPAMKEGYHLILGFHSKNRISEL
jgi:hypothetical protein